MSRPKLLLDVAGDLRNLADSVRAVADAMYESDIPVQVPTPASPKPTAPAVTLKEVRIALAEKSRLGFTEQVRELLIQNGAEKLSNIDPSKYEALLRGAEVIGNG